MVPLTVSSRTRRRLRAMAASLLLLFAFGVYKVLRQYPNRWAQVVPVGDDFSDESTKRQILRGLQKVEQAEKVRPGALSPLADFFTASGSRTRLTLVEGTFLASDIEPAYTWQRLGQRLTLVNSVNQDQDLAQGISLAIGTGCGVSQARRIPLNLGDVSINRCVGLYHKRDRVDWVINMAVILQQNPNSERLPCRNSGSDTDTKYQQCVAEAVSTALRNFFKELHRRSDLQATSIVFPAVGTGRGGLQKDLFYETLFSQILKELANERYQLPSTIYLQVWGGDRTAWSQTKNAIATRLADTVTDWNDTEHRYNGADWAAVLGVAGGMALLLLGASFGRSLPFLRKDAAGLAANPSIALLIGWFSASLGLVTVFKSMIEQLPRTFLPWPQIVVGSIVALGCGPLLRAAQRFDSTIKPQQVDPIEGEETLSLPV
jgi:hypothetical protein